MSTLTCLKTKKAVLQILENELMKCKECKKDFGNFVDGLEIAIELVKNMENKEKFSVLQCVKMLNEFRKLFERYSVIDVTGLYHASTIVFCYEKYQKRGECSVKCSKCGCADKLRFNQKNDDMTVTMLCVDCLNEKDDKKRQGEEREDSYYIKWKLRGEKGGEWIEEHRNMSLSDFEVLYGANIYEIVWLNMRKKGVAML